MKKTGVMLVVFLMVLSTFIMPVFGTTIPSGSTFSKGYEIKDSDNVTRYNGNIFITPLAPHVVDLDIEFTQNNTYPSYTIYPVNSSGQRVSSISSHTTSSTGGSINLNSPTSTGSQSGRYTIGDLNTTTTVYGFNAIPSGGSSSNTQHSYYCVQYDFLICFNMWNISEQLYGKNGSTISFKPQFSFPSNASYLGCSFESLYNDGLYLFTIINDTIYLVADSDHTQYGSIVITPSGCIQSMLKFSVFALMTDNYSTAIPTVSSVDIGSLGTAVLNDNFINPSELQQLYNLNNTLALTYNDLHTMVQAYASNSTNIDNTQSNINSTDDIVLDLHDQELTYYQQNESALNNVGLSNFSFDSDQSSGLGTVVTDFTTLWNNIGPLQIIFTFTLSLSLATYLLRHRPITNAIKKNDRK